MNMSANFGSFGARAISGTYLNVGVCSLIRPVTTPIIGGWQVGAAEPVGVGSKRRKHR
jgi:hypothetical protein